MQELTLQQAIGLAGQSLSVHHPVFNWGDEIDILQRLDLADYARHGYSHAYLYRPFSTVYLTKNPI